MKTAYTARWKAQYDSKADHEELSWNMTYFMDSDFKGNERPPEHIPFKTQISKTQHA